MMSIRHVVTHVTSISGFALILGLAPVELSAQTKDCEPVADRAGRTLGCFVTARAELGALPRDTALYWHIDGFKTHAEATAAATARGTVVESLGKIWLFTIAPKAWRPRAGTRAATIGPLALVDAPRFAAVYMEGTFKPGMQSPVHRHPGVEAWHTLEGAQCLETPNGKLVQRAGDPGVMVKGGDPMQLTGIGTTIRKSLVLILQDTSQPRSIHAMDWTPKGLCLS